MELKKLKDKLPFQWRVQSINDHAAVCVAYIDSRDVQDALDNVVGPESWQSDYKDVKGNLFAGIGIAIADQWVWKWDCGTESKVEKEKGEASDSFKRAAVKWGIGRFLYDLPIVRLKVTKYKDKNYALNEATGKAIFDGKELTTYINEGKPKGQPAAPQEPTEGVKELPWLNPGKNQDWLNAHSKFHTGLIDLDGIKKAYRLSKDAEAKLKDPNFKP